MVTQWRASHRRRRDFWREVGIVILGVVLALAAQQMAEWVHGGQEARDARENIRREIAHNLGRLSNRAPTEPCIARRLQEIAGLIDVLASGGPPVEALWIGRPQTWAMNEARWNAAAQSGRASLLSPADQAGFALLYAHFRVLEEAQAREQAAWSQLRALEGLRRPPEGAEWALRNALQEARYSGWRVRLAAAQATEDAARMGIRPGQPERSGNRSACIPLRTERLKALRMIGSDQP